ncbi:putative thiamine transport system permease protein [Tranquillimonas alkanivorans]|uniref:Putative thiamine transport system permease protein n=2 Tax=Tranquillimonas alkanivorans TaxID=441119 RepID=A0A1I5LLB4_9RHOB|nr:putative thiamine transport system permease protein [Tranquillimonas alkanivorans]
MAFAETPAAAPRATLRASRSTLTFVPLLTLAAMLGPICAGLAGTVLPALGWYPAAGTTALDGAPIRALLAWPGLADAARLSLTTGLAATALSLGIVALVFAGWWGTRPFGMLERLLSPLLSVPHAAAAFGLAFLIAPSGWLFRLAAPLIGWDRPPDLLILNDPWGLSLTAGLVAKEVPFLTLMALAALGQSDGRRSLRAAQAMGYGRLTGWLKTVFPRVYAQIRLPVYVVLAYSMSVVDAAVILGPTTPNTLSVQIVRWMGDPDLGQRLVAAAGAVLQLALVAAALALWRGGEHVVALVGRAWILGGDRGRLDRVLRPLGLMAGVLSAAAVLAGLVALVMWSVAGFWSFPDVWPDTVTWRSWSRHGAGLAEAARMTAVVALASTGIALILVLGCLEAEHRSGRRLTRRGLWLLYLPLLVPQIAFLPGLQTLLLTAGADTGLLPVIAAHLVFVLPYVFLSLGDPWRAWDVRHATVAAALGASPRAVLWRVRLPMLLRPVLTATAVGLAVSVGQYLPTLLIGGGRVATLTTEAVALAAGGDRRAIGVYSVAQTAAALLPFALALGIPALAWRNRRGLHG